MFYNLYTSLSFTKLEFCTHAVKYDCYSLTINDFIFNVGIDLRVYQAGYMQSLIRTWVVCLGDKP